MADLKVLVDYHHPDLYWSFVLLGRRLGWKIYRPIGMDWFHEGYWRFEAHWAGDRYAKMFLPFLPDDMDEGESGHRPDPRHGGHFDILSLGQARDIGLDIIISTVPGNYAGFKHLAKEVGARHVHQLGNQEHLAQLGTPDKGGTRLLVSTNVVPEGWEFLRYDQEMDPLFTGYVPIQRHGPVSFFVFNDHNLSEVVRFVDVAARAKHIDWKGYGPLGVNLERISEVASAMRESSIIYHSKMVGDGWGHTIHAAMAMGRPIIGNASYYKDRVAERFWTPENSIDTSRMSEKMIAEATISLWSDFNRLQEMGYRSRELFTKYIDYAADAERIKEFLDV